MSVKSFFRKLLPARKKPDAPMNSILIVDDDPALRDNLTDILEGEGYQVFTAATAAEASKLARETMPWLALVDLKLPDGSGTALLSELKQIRQECVCILMTAYADVESAVLAIERGVFYYLRKPVNPAELLELVDLGFETIRLKEEKRATEEALRARNRELEEIISRLRSLIDSGGPEKRT